MYPVAWQLESGQTPRTGLYPQIDVHTSASALGGQATSQQAAHRVQPQLAQQPAAPYAAQEKWWQLPQNQASAPGSAAWQQQLASQQAVWQQQQTAWQQQQPQVLAWQQQQASQPCSYPSGQFGSAPAPMTQNNGQVYPSLQPVPPTGAWQPVQPQPQPQPQPQKQQAQPLQQQEVAVLGGTTASSGANFYPRIHAGSRDAGGTAAAAALATPALTTAVSGAPATIAGSAALYPNLQQFSAPSPSSMISSSSNTAGYPSPQPLCAAADSIATSTPSPQQPQAAAPWSLPNPAGASGAAVPEVAGKSAAELAAGTSREQQQEQQYSTHATDGGIGAACGGDPSWGEEAEGCDDDALLALLLGHAPSAPPASHAMLGWQPSSSFSAMAPFLGHAPSAPPGSHPFIAHHTAADSCIDGDGGGTSGCCGGGGGSGGDSGAQQPPPSDCLPAEAAPCSAFNEADGLLQEQAGGHNGPAAGMPPLDAGTADGLSAAVIAAAAARGPFDALDLSSKLQLLSLTAADQGPKAGGSTPGTEGGGDGSGGSGNGGGGGGKDSSQANGSDSSATLGPSPAGPDLEPSSGQQQPAPTQEEAPQQRSPPEVPADTRSSDGGQPASVAAGNAAAGEVAGVPVGAPGSAAGSGGSSAGGSSAAVAGSSAGTSKGRLLSPSTSVTDISFWEVQFEDIKLQRPIGEGSFGKVYEGKWNETLVAVKVFSQIDEVQQAAGPEAAWTLSNPILCNLQKECGLMAALRHPNVLQFMGVSPRPPALISEYCSKGSLADVLAAARNSPQKAAQLTWPRRLNLALDATKGMLYLHKRGLVHRDLKSPNLLVDSNWRVKVADFNLSKIMDGASGGGYTSSLANMNPRWLAPEIVTGSSATPSSDVYAWGVVMWELLTWKQPWKKLNDWAVAGQLRSGGRLAIPACDEAPGPPLPTYDAYVSLMQRCWAEDPAQRPGFASVVVELRAMMEAVVRGAGAASTHSAQALGTQP